MNQWIDFPSNRDGEGLRDAAQQSLEVK